PDMAKKSDELYHGGTFIDEIAAIASLCLGARIRAGGESRSFDSDDDPLGRPKALHDTSIPVVSVRQGRVCLPSVLGTHSLDELKRLSSIPFVSPAGYVGLVRACRFYQDALWVAESEPNLAWLMLVSALETAANEFIASASSPERRLRESKAE